MGTKSITFTDDQEMVLELFVEAQLFNNQSEAVRAAFEAYVRQLEPERRLRVAVELYRKKPVSISRAAEVAGLPFQALEEILKREGILRRGAPESLRRRTNRPKLQVPTSNSRWAKTRRSPSAKL